MEWRQFPERSGREIPGASLRIYGEYFFVQDIDVMNTGFPLLAPVSIGNEPCVTSRWHCERRLIKSVGHSTERACGGVPHAQLEDIINYGHGFSGHETSTAREAQLTVYG